MANLECYVQTEVNRLTDWIAVGTVALRVNQIIEVIPCNQVVGIHANVIEVTAPLRMTVHREHLPLALVGISSNRTLSSGSEELREIVINSKKNKETDSI